MNQMTIDVQQGRQAIIIDQVIVPNLVIQCPRFGTFRIQMSRRRRGGSGRRKFRRGRGKGRNDACCQEERGKGGRRKNKSHDAERRKRRRTILFVTHTKTINSKLSGALWLLAVQSPDQRLEQEAKIARLVSLNPRRRSNWFVFLGCHEIPVLP